MNLPDNDFDREEQAAIEAELQQHAASQSHGDDGNDVVGLLRSAGLSEKTAIQTDMLMRWVDGEMGETERSLFKIRLGSDAQLSADAKWMRRLGDDIRRSFSMEVPVPEPAKFNELLLQKMTVE